MLEGLGLNGEHWQTPAYHVGDGAVMLESSRASGLEGLELAAKSVVYSDSEERPTEIVFNVLFTSNGLTTNAPWEFLASDQVLGEFSNWLRAQIAITVLAKLQTLGQNDPNHWLTQHVERTFREGMGRVFDFLQRPEYKVKQDYYQGSKEEFLRSAFTRPVSIDRLKLLAARAFNELVGITDQMAVRMQRVMTDGLARGDNPRVIARNLNREVGLSIKRSQVSARTELFAR